MCGWLAMAGDGRTGSEPNTALITLAREVPPVVLADRLGSSIRAAVRWRDLCASSDAIGCPDCGDDRFAFRIGPHSGGT